jgi:hypothetical protein
MYQVEIWIDVVCRGDDRNETLCTLFADHKLPVRPLIGETMGFYQSKGSNLEYMLISPIGPVRQSSVRVAVDDVSHYAVNEEGEISFKTALKCSEIPVNSEEDARMICKFMTEQLGFEVDPYGVNKLAP